MQKVHSTRHTYIAKLPMIYDPSSWWPLTQQKLKKLLSNRYYLQPFRDNWQKPWSPRRRASFPWKCCEKSFKPLQGTAMSSPSSSSSSFSKINHKLLVVPIESACKLHRMQKLTPFYKSQWIPTTFQLHLPEWSIKTGRGVRAGERKTITVFFFLKPITKVKSSSVPDSQCED